MEINNLTFCNNTLNKDSIGISVSDKAELKVWNSKFY